MTKKYYSSEVLHRELISNSNEKIFKYIETFYYEKEECPLLISKLQNSENKEVKKVLDNVIKALLKSIYHHKDPVLYLKTLVSNFTALGCKFSDPITYSDFKKNYDLQNDELIRGALAALALMFICLKNDEKTAYENYRTILENLSDEDIQNFYNSIPTTDDIETPLKEFKKITEEKDIFSQEKALNESSFLFNDDDLNLNQSYISEEIEEQKENSFLLDLNDEKLEKIVPQKEKNILSLEKIPQDFIQKNDLHMTKYFKKISSLKEKLCGKEIENIILTLKNNIENIEEKYILINTFLNDYLNQRAKIKNLDHLLASSTLEFLNDMKKKLKEEINNVFNENDSLLKKQLLGNFELDLEADEETTLKNILTLKQNLSLNTCQTVDMHLKPYHEKDGAYTEQIKQYKGSTYNIICEMARRTTLTIFTILTVGIPKLLLNYTIFRESPAYRAIKNMAQKTENNIKNLPLLTLSG